MRTRTFFRRCSLPFICLGFSVLQAWPWAPFAQAGLRARYDVLSTQDRAAPPFAEVDVVLGPREKHSGTAKVWWQLEIRTNANSQTDPICIVRGLTASDPWADGQSSSNFARYLLKIPATGETLEYRDRHTGRALLPNWGDFERHFLPRRVKEADFTNGIPTSCDFLGHLLTLREVQAEVMWKPWDDATTLALDRELLVGTGRNFRDTQGHRLPQTVQGPDYQYIEFEQPEYRTMIEAGMNLFVVGGRQEPWVRHEPVFYIRRPTRQEPLRYPTDLYRANYLGPAMFVDEPAALLSGDPQVRGKLSRFSDAAALIQRRTEVTYESDGSYGSYLLDRTLREARVNLGGYRLKQTDYPCWETYYETAFYQFAGGAAGFVHEGRYQLPAFDAAVGKLTGKLRAHSGKELLRYHYAFLRGAARRFGRDWGTAIYGQCDPVIAGDAVTTAYDMGARYVWFWTSDHGHHVPWPEQLQLARLLKRHAAGKPRRSLALPPSKLDTVITLPTGWFVSLYDPWWDDLLNPQAKDQLSRQHHGLAEQLLAAVEDCFAKHHDFDITVDEGRPIKGYQRIMRIKVRD
jgi:hypothetical protein